MRRLALALTLALCLGLGCNRPIRCSPEIFFWKPTECRSNWDCVHDKCQKGLVPACFFHFRAGGYCECFPPVDGGPPDLDPSHLPNPFHINDAGKVVPNDDDGGT
jgi:hypothetical protein